MAIPKVNYGSVTNPAGRSWFTYLLWEMITPGYTAIFMFLTGLWYAYKAWNTDIKETKAAFNEAALAFGLWGIFNGFCYVYLAMHK